MCGLLPKVLHEAVLTQNFWTFLFFLPAVQQIIKSISRYMLSLNWLIQMV